MSTGAHKATFTAAKGRENGGFRVFDASQRRNIINIPTHKELKERRGGQGTTEEIAKRDLLAELRAKEEEHFKTKYKNDPNAEKYLRLLDSRTKEEPLKAIQDGKVDEESKDSAQVKSTAATSTGEGKETVADEEEMVLDINLDHLPQGLDDDDSDSEDSDSDSDSDSDDDAELLRELERLKARREEEKKQQELERFQQEEEERQRVLSGAAAAEEDELSGSVIKRKWWERSVFKNQAKGVPAKKTRFINDTTRNDFHRRFMNKYVQ